jgi:hypothetical protein
MLAQISSDLDIIDSFLWLSADWPARPRVAHWEPYRGTNPPLDFRQNLAHFRYVLPAQAVD